MSSTPKTLFSLLNLIVWIVLLSSCSGGGSSSSSPVTVGDQLQQGELRVSVDGSGYLILQTAGGSQVLAKSVVFGLDDMNNLLTADNELLLGFLPVGTVNTGGALAPLSIGDNVEVSITEEGEVISSNNVMLGQVALANIRTPFHLLNIGDGRWIETEQSGLPLIGTPLTSTFGKIVFGDVSVQPVETGFNLKSTPNYFVLSNGTQQLYSDESFFIIDKEGYLSDIYDRRVMGYIYDGSGDLQTAGLAPVSISNDTIAPRSTTDVSLSVALKSTNSLGGELFNPDDPSTYNFKVSTIIYDSRGASHELQLYFLQTANFNVWNLYTYIPDEMAVNQNVVSAAGGVGGRNPYFELQFGADGTLLTSDPIVLSVDAWNPVGANTSSTAGGTIETSDFTIDLDEITFFGGDEYRVSNIMQDGHPSAEIDKISISKCGLVSSTTTHDGLILNIGQLVTAAFNNPSALVDIDGLVLAASVGSGDAVIGVPCEDGFDEISSIVEFD